MSSVDLYSLTPEYNPEPFVLLNRSLNFSEVMRHRISKVPCNPYENKASMGENKQITLIRGGALFDGPLPCSEKGGIFNQPSLCSNRDLPIFSSMNLPVVRTWGQWLFESLYMDYAADQEVLPELPCNNTSMTFRTSGDVHPSVRIGGINGIGNSLWDAVLHSEYLQGFTNSLAVEWVYNCSNFIPIDALETAVINMAGYSPVTSNLLKNNWIAFHEENLSHPNAKYLQHCHSQGAVHVKNALQELPKEVRERVIVVAIAPATVIPNKLCYQAYNYASKSDIISKVEMFLGGSDMLSELTLLDPHPEASGFDHSYQSPTYFSVIANHIKDYLDMYG